MAKNIPEEEFWGLVTWYKNMIKTLPGMRLKLNYDVAKKELEDFDTVIIATGVHPREPSIGGLDHQHVYYYKDILKGGVDIGSKVAIVGAGGIGFDVAEFLSIEIIRAGNFQPLPEWMTQWGMVTLRYAGMVF